MQSCKQGSLAAVTISLNLGYEEKEPVSEFPQETTWLSVRKRKRLSRDSFKSVKSKELQYNIDSVHAILTNFTRNYGEIILCGAFSV